MRSNQARSSSARHPEPVRCAFEMPASISADVTAERNSASVRSSNQVVTLGATAGLPGAKTLKTLVSSSQPVTDRPCAAARYRARSPRHGEFPSAEQQNSAGQSDIVALPLQ